MAAEKSGYFKTAWADVRSSKGWAVRSILLGLLQLIPIFGQIVFNGYMLGWARELAWNIKAPMPKSIFENRDGKLYRQGWYALVIYVVFFILVAILLCVGIALLMTRSSVTSSAYYMRRNGFSVTPTMVAGIIVLVVAFVLLIIATLFTWSGQLRMSVYDRFGAGFQMSKLKNMIRADFGGIMRIFLMCVIMTLISLAVVGLVFFILILINKNFLYLSYALIATGLSGLNTTIARAVMIFFAVSILLSFVLYTFMSFANMIVYRALGYWLAQFDVPSWPSMNEDVAFRKFKTKDAPKKAKHKAKNNGEHHVDLQNNAGGASEQNNGEHPVASTSNNGEHPVASTSNNGEHPTSKQATTTHSQVVVAGKELANMQRERASKAQQVAMIQEGQLQEQMPVQPSDPKTGLIENPSIEVDVLEPIFDKNECGVRQENEVQKKEKPAPKQESEQEDKPRN